MLQNVERNTKPENKLWDEISEGWTYWVPVKETGERGNEGKQQSQTEEGSQGKQVLKLKGGKWVKGRKDDLDDSSSSSADGDPKRVAAKAKRKMARAKARAVATVKTLKHILGCTCRATHPHSNTQ